MTSEFELQSDFELYEQSIAQKILRSDELSTLNDRSNWKGLAQLFGHLSVMGVSGYLWLKFSAI
jgi:hypothetical protein